MAVYGIGAVIALLKLAEEMERQAAQNRGQSQGLGDLLNASREVLSGGAELPGADLVPKKKKKRRSAYSRRYSAAFKRLAPKYKKKSGGWKKDGFRRCAAAARKVAKK